MIDQITIKKNVQKPLNYQNNNKLSDQSLYYGSTGCGVFKWMDTKLERFLHKNRHTQRKSLNFEFWVNGELSKIGHHFSKKVI